VDYRITPPIKLVSLGEIGGIGKYLITKSEWDVVCKLPRRNLDLAPTYCRESHSRDPVNNVNWLEVQEFCERLYHATSIRYRLPTSEEWDLAAVRNPRPKRDFLSSNIRPVDKQIPNELGIYGMFGSYWQWTHSGPRSDSLTRPAKGGSYGNIRDMEEIAYVSANHRSSVVGFRIFSEVYRPDNPVETLDWLKK